VIASSSAALAEVVDVDVDAAVVDVVAELVVVVVVLSPPPHAVMPAAPTRASVAKRRINPAVR
jgi:hypothetical protein